jgi:5-methylcytosine-specific restriction endonuclease McrA
MEPEAMSDDNTTPPDGDDAIARRKAAQRRAQKAHQLAFPEKYRAACKRYAEKTRERKAAYRQANRERDAERERQWVRDNPDKVRASNHRRLAQKRAAEGCFTPADTHEIRERQQDCCAACAVPLQGGGEIDHVVPLSRGGTNWPSNLQWLCRFCNRSKGPRTMDEFLLSRGGRRG